MPQKSEHADNFSRYMKGFDIVNLEPWVDWFNAMTYDIRKMIRPHTRREQD